MRHTGTFSYCLHQDSTTSLCSHNHSIPSTLMSNFKFFLHNTILCINILFISNIRQFVTNKYVKFRHFWMIFRVCSTVKFMLSRTVREVSAVLCLEGNRDAESVRWLQPLSVSDCSLRHL